MLKNAFSYKHAGYVIIYVFWEKVEEETIELRVPQMTVPVVTKWPHAVLCPKIVSVSILRELGP